MLAGMQEDVRTILETAGLGNFFLSFPHVDAALAAT
jgi:anti-anti-sigma regulatory factor